jgi:hypothetical protein
MSVTNFDDCNVAIFKIQSAAAAYNITLPFRADCIEWFNYTKYGTANTDATISKQGIWFDGFPAGDGLIMLTIVDNGVTALKNLVLETTNGVTYLGDGSGFAATNVTPTAINVTTSVVTVAANTFTEGQFVRGTNFRATPIADATGCYGCNNRVFQIGAVTATTFELLEPYTNVIADLSAETAFANTGVAKFNLIGQSLGTVNPAPVYQYTLGSVVMGADNDLIYVKATKANVYTNLGDVA